MVLSVILSVVSIMTWGTHCKSSAKRLGTSTKVVSVLTGGVTPGSHLFQQLLVRDLMDAISASGGIPACVAFKCFDSTFS